MDFPHPHRLSKPFDRLRRGKALAFVLPSSNKFCRKAAPFPFHAPFQILTEFAIMCMISEQKLCFATKIAHNFIALQWVA